MLCAAAPLPASSGKTQRHRLNRGGDRQANSALHLIVVTRMRVDQRTNDYVARRIAQGHSKPEIIRCLKRYVARQIYYLLKPPPKGTSSPGPLDKQESIRGCQYTSRDYATLAGDLEVVLSHGRTGQCWDNALAESFFASLKGECLNEQPWPTRAAARRAVVEYIGWYNGARLHSALGYLTPDEFESTINKEAIQQAA
jgi:transposase InsO family protein